MSDQIYIPNLGSFDAHYGLVKLDACSDGYHLVGKDGVVSVSATADRKVEFIAKKDHTLAYVNSKLDYPSYYPLHPVKLKKPIQAVLMDLDGTSIHSEKFWIWIIEQTISSLLGNPVFSLEEADMPFVAGHSVSEHLTYCIEKYCPEKSLESARHLYFMHTHVEMEKILKGTGRENAFVPAPGLKEFLYGLKNQKIKIGLVTSGLYEKAYPAVRSAFQSLGMGDPKEFYDVIISGGFPVKQGEFGTMGELAPKPHPWLYAEAARIGLSITFDQRNSIVGIEDSGAGVCSVRLAGFTTIGVSGGNIVESGSLALCDHYCDNLESIEKIII
ncbi:MAG: HAD family phosphatase [Chloroflexi bacterium]|nr:HAD family phosphatase [Chloroflexota bacterium]